MSPKKLLNAAQEYFSNINPIATRIYADFEDTKNSYESVWNTLSFEEQTQILNECIIKPEITLQYSLKPNISNENNPNTYKKIIDETASYKDEHSAPFSFRTSSQADLRLFGSENERKVIKTPKLEPVKIKLQKESGAPNAASVPDLLPKTGLDFLDNW